jgi:AraC family transcriptional regulator
LKTDNQVRDGGELFALCVKNLIEHPASKDQCYFDALGIVIAYQLLRLHRTNLSRRSLFQGGLAAWQQRIATTYIDQHLHQRRHRRK